MPLANALKLSLKQENLITFWMISLFPLVGMGIDLISPSLPSIALDLKTSAAVSKNLVSIYLLSYALGAFLIGFLSDSLGRRKLIIGWTVCFVIVSLLASLASSSFLLYVMRFLQGFAMGAVAVIACAILADILDPDKLTSASIIRVTMWGLGPIIGPVIGGYLEYYFGWHYCFYFFAIYGFIFLIGLLFIPETHTDPHPIHFLEIKNDFLTIVSHRIFMGFVILMGTSYSLIIVFNTLGPFLIQTVLNYSAISFGYIALSMGVIFLLGTIMCKKLTQKYGLEKVILFSIHFYLILALLGLMAAFVYNKDIVFIMILNLLMFLGCGIIHPACMGAGVVIFKHRPGGGAAIMNVITVLITSLVAFASSFTLVTGILSLAWVYFIIMVASIVCYWTLVRQQALL